MTVGKTSILLNSVSVEWRECGREAGRAGSWFGNFPALKGSI
ncbi:hypothetical protein N9E91_03875 [Alphaproteobacteria bacterium]|nr:hypothetical protein [Alphaproteobacteria bacterium]